MKEHAHARRTRVSHPVSDLQSPFRHGAFGALIPELQYWLGQNILALTFYPQSHLLAKAAEAAITRDDHLQHALVESRQLQRLRQFFSQAHVVQQPQPAGGSQFIDGAADERRRLELTQKEEAGSETIPFLRGEMAGPEFMNHPPFQPNLGAHPGDVIAHIIQRKLQVIMQAL